MKALIHLASMVALCAPAFSADLVVKTTRHCDNPRIKDVAVTTWIGKDRMRVEDGDRKVLIVRADLKKMFVLDPKGKAFGTLELPFVMKDHVPPEIVPKFDELMANLHFSVTPTSETKKIHDWNATKYVLTISDDAPDHKTTITADVWATKDVVVDGASWNSMNGAATSFMLSGPDMSAELAKIQGLPVLVERTHTTGDKTLKFTEEVTSVESKDAPEGAYDVPKDYTEMKPFILGDSGPHDSSTHIAPAHPGPPPDSKKDGEKPVPPPK